MRVMGAMVELTQVYHLAAAYFMGNLLARPYPQILDKHEKSLYNLIICHKNKCYLIYYLGIDPSPINISY